MRNLVQDGLIVPLTAPMAREPGDIVRVGAIVGVAVGRAAQGETVQVRLEGVYSGLPIKAGDSFAAGEIAYYDAAEDELTETVTGNEVFGVALGGGKFLLGRNARVAPVELPAFTAPADNGKVLTIVTGAPAWATPD